MQARGKAASTIKTEISAVRFWHDQVPNARYVLPKNEELDLERRKFGGIDRSWSQEEYNRMIALCWELEREDYAAIFTLTHYAGLRIHECFKIDTAIAEKALKINEITIRGKGGRVRSVPINESIKIELEKMLKVTERGKKLFVPDGIQTHIAINRLQKFIYEHKEQVQDPDSTRPFTHHGLRHLYTAEQYLALREKGDNDLTARKKASHLLGHNRHEITKVYLASLSRMEGSQ